MYAEGSDRVAYFIEADTSHAIFKKFHSWETRTWTVQQSTQARRRCRLQHTGFQHAVAAHGTEAICDRPCHGDSAGPAIARASSKHKGLKREPVLPRMTDLLW